MTSSDALDGIHRHARVHSEKQPWSMHGYGSCTYGLTSGRAVFQVLLGDGAMDASAGRAQDIPTC